MVGDLDNYKKSHELCKELVNKLARLDKDQRNKDLQEEIIKGIDELLRYRDEEHKINDSLKTLFTRFKIEMDRLINEEAKITRDEENSFSTLRNLRIYRETLKSNEKNPSMTNGPFQMDIIQGITQNLSILQNQSYQGIDAVGARKRVVDVEQKLISRAMKKE